MSAREPEPPRQPATPGRLRHRQVVRQDYPLARAEQAITWVCNFQEALFRSQNDAKPQLAFGCYYRSLRGPGCSDSAVCCHGVGGLRAKAK
jgi:hypothetical protein